ncbi:MAG: TMEM175 family protein [Chitinophagaceae bacterium]
MTKSRLEAFSDGVLAIIITIMVLELKVPHGDASWQALKELLPVFASYIASFIIVGIYWANHHHLLHTVKEVRGGMLWANLNLLFWLSLIPFATAWMGETNFARNPVIVYTLLADLCGIAYYILLTVIRKCNPGNHSLLEVLHKQTRKGMLSNLFNTLAIAGAFYHPAIGGGFLLLVFLMWLIPDRNIERASKEI